LTIRSIVDTKAPKKLAELSKILHEDFRRFNVLPDAVKRCSNIVPFGSPGAFNAQYSHVFS
jgi:hypothetical protein